MIRIHVTTRDGAVAAVPGRGGMSLMEAAVAAGIDGIEAECGGACSCATCHVHVRPDWYTRVGEPSEMEGELLGLVEDRRPTSRLSCQIKLSLQLDGLAVEIPSGMESMR